MSVELILVQNCMCNANNNQICVRFSVSDDEPPIHIEKIYTSSTLVGYEKLNVS